MFAWLMEHGADKVPAHPPPALPRLCGVPRRRVGGLHAWVGLGAEMLRPARSLPPPLSEGLDPPQPQALQALTEWHAPPPSRCGGRMRSTTTASRPSPSLPGLPPPLSTFLPRPTPIQLSTFRLPSPLRPCLPAPIRSVRVVRLTNHPGPATGRPERTATPRLLAPAGGRMNGPARRSTWAAGLPSVGMVDSAGPEPRPGRPGNGAPTVWLRASYAPAHRVTCSSESRRQNHGDGVTATQSRRRSHGDGITATGSLVWTGERARLAPFAPYPAMAACLQASKPCPPARPACAARRACAARYYDPKRRRSAAGHRMPLNPSPPVPSHPPRPPSPPVPPSAASGCGICSTLSAPPTSAAPSGSLQTSGDGLCRAVIRVVP